MELLIVLVIPADNIRQAALVIGDELANNLSSLGTYAPDPPPTHLRACTSFGSLDVKSSYIGAERDPCPAITFTQIVQNLQS